MRAGNHESGQLPSRQFLAKSRKSGGQRHAAFGLFECLEMGFEHRLTTLRSRGELRNVTQIAAFWHRLCFNNLLASEGMEQIAATGSCFNGIWENSRSVSTQRRGDTQCLLFRLRRFRRRSVAARSLQSPKNNAASSSRFSVVL